MTNQNLYIAVDLGAGSGRVFLAGLAPRELLLEEIRRFRYEPSLSHDHLRWNFAAILEEIKIGLRAAGERSRELGRPIFSIGVDSWGVDYGLIDKTGALLDNPVCYRDDRTSEAMEKVFARVSREEIFRKTGIQFLVFNTLFQLQTENGRKDSVRKLLLIPDLINFVLTGRAVNEYTNATTTQMVDAISKNWDPELIRAVNFDPVLFGEIVPAGTDLGVLTSNLADELQLPDTHVIAPATHDTGSAIAGAPLRADWAYISSGTWSLVGVERDQPLIDMQAAQHNFTNEGGAFGTIRFLKNVMGLWIFESCRKEWKERGIDVDYDRLLNDVEAIEGFNGFIFPDDERLLNPPSMLEAIKTQMTETRQSFNDNPAAISKIIFDSLAFRYASVLRTIETLTGKRIAGVQIVGGGGRNNYLNQRTADASGLPVQAGLTEATVTGNVVVQAITAGRFSSLAEARAHVAKNVKLNDFFPNRPSDFTATQNRYIEIEQPYLRKQL